MEAAAQPSSGGPSTAKESGAHSVATPSSFPNPRDSTASVAGLQSTSGPISAQPTPNPSALRPSTTRPVASAALRRGTNLPALLDDANQLVNELLVYRGFGQTLAAFHSDSSARGDVLESLSSSRLVRKLASDVDALKLEGILTWWDSSIESVISRANFLDGGVASNARLLRDSTLRLYLVEAVRRSRPDLVNAFLKEQFPLHVSATRFRDEWRRNWFALPFIENPEKDKYFSGFFQQEWRNALFASIESLLNSIFSALTPPRLLLLATAKDEILTLRAEIADLKAGLLTTSRGTPGKALASTSSPMRKLHVRRSLGDDEFEDESPREGNVSPSEGQDVHLASFMQKSPAFAEPHLAPIDLLEHSVVSSVTSSPLMQHTRLAARHSALEPTGPPPSAEGERSLLSQGEDVLGRMNGPVTRVRYSPSGYRAAACSADATLRIWAKESQGGSGWSPHGPSLLLGASGNALDWFDDQLLAAGSRDHVCKIWRLSGSSANGYPVSLSMRTSPLLPVVCDLAFDPGSPSGSSLAASVAPARARSLSSTRAGAGEIQIWNLETEKIDRSLTIDPVAAGANTAQTTASLPTRLSCLKFNHNGTLLVVGGSDGVVRVYDSSRSGMPIMGWPAYSDYVECIGLCLGSTETTLFSLGSNGVLVEWNLHKMGEIVSKVKLSEPLMEPTGSSAKRRAPTHRRDVCARSDGRYLAVSGSSSVLDLVASKEAIHSVFLDADGPLGATLGSSSALDWQDGEILIGQVDGTVRARSV